MKEIVLGNKMVALVDDQDFELLSKFKWQARIVRGGQSVYVQRVESVNGKQRSIIMHRQILDIKDSKIQVDHKDCNGLNNQRDNLRACTQVQNLANRRLNENSTSGYKGVYWDKKFGKWRAHIGFNGKLRVIGYSDNKEAAAEMYNREALKLSGEFARLNVI